MLTIADQLARLTPVVLPKHREMTEDAADRALMVFDALKSIGNATPTVIGERLPFPIQSVRRYLRVLMREGKVVSWRINNRSWYSVARPAKRRK